MLTKRRLHFQRILALQKLPATDKEEATGSPMDHSDYSLSEGVRPRRVSNEQFLARFNKIQDLQSKGKTHWRPGEV